MKKFFKILFIPIFVILAIVILAIIGLVIAYYVRREKPENYIPDSFSAYAHVKSIETVFDRLTTLKAANFLLANESTAAINEIYLSVKSNNLLDKKISRWLLNVEANIVLTEDDQPLLIMDLGIRSIATTLFSFVDSSIAIENLNIKRIGGHKIYEYPIDEKSFVYLGIKNNLLFISPNLVTIDATLSNKETGKNIATNNTIEKIASYGNKSNFIDIYTDTSSLLGKVKLENKIFKNFIKSFTFQDKSILSFDISNEMINTEVFSLVEVKNSQMDDFLSWSPKPSQIVEFAPETTNILTTFNFNSYADFYKLILSLAGEDYEKTMKTLNNVSNMLFKMSIEKLIFEWIDNESGLFTLSNSADPIVFISIKDMKKFNTSMDQIASSVFLNTTDAIILDGVRLSKIELPAGLKPLVNSIMKGFDTPYYIVEENFVFFSMNPENLTQILSYRNSKKTLANEEDFKEATKNTGSNIFMYYNLNEGIPSFFANNELFSNLMSLYSTGVAEFNIDKETFNLSVTATGTRKISVHKYPGYPKKENEGISSNIVKADLFDTSSKDFLYKNNMNELVLLSTTGAKQKYQVGANSLFYVNSDKTISIFEADGNFFTINPKENVIIEESKKSTTWQPQFEISTDGSNFYYFSMKEKGIIKQDTLGNCEVIITDIQGLVFNSPAVSKNIIAIYPRKINGKLFIYKNNQLENEVEVEGICQSGPVISEKNILIQMQNGLLYNFDLNGQLEKGFPVEFEGDSFSAKPIFIRDGKKYKIAVISNTGRLTIINEDGSIDSEISLKRHFGRESKLVAKDFNNNKTDEIFIYGDANYILGYTNKLSPLKNFPIIGSGMPDFADYDRDGKDEIVCKDLNNNINVYFLNKELQ
ncbi:MAG: VCBS repeat-containing protein [Spirochaetales bacterium]|nr:VCBS repeat-containing protein [Spirochaetales bacterium]